MEAGSRTKIRGVLVWFACSLELSQGSQRYCSVLRPHLPLISPPSISSSAFPAVFLLWSLFSCFRFVVEFNNIRLYNKNRRTKQTNIQTLYVTECVGVCGSTLYVCVLMALDDICVIKNATSLEVQETQRIIIIYFLRHCSAGLLNCDTMKLM